MKLARITLLVLFLAACNAHVVNCPAGKFRIAKKCYPCSYGKYQPHSGRDHCKSCLSGQSTVTAKYGNSACAPCAAGKYSHKMAKQCSVCPKGRYGFKGESHSALCSGSCTKGHHATVIAFQGDATASCGGECTVGKFATPGKFACVVCPGNKYSAQVAAVSCTTCSDVTKADPTHTKCLKVVPTNSPTGVPTRESFTCPPGKHINPDQLNEKLDRCLFCDTGTYQSGVSQKKCLYCPPGKFTPHTGLYNVATKKGYTSCLLCPTGKYNKETARPYCHKCTAGYYGSTTGLQSDRCTAQCPAGTFGIPGASDPACTAPCAPGRYGWAGQDDQSCSGPCKAGRYSGPPAGAFGQVEALCADACPAGKFAPAGSEACTACGRLHYQSQEAQKSCKLCGIGSATTEGHSVCQVCAKGKMVNLPAGDQCVGSHPTLYPTSPPTPPTPPPTPVPTPLGCSDGSTVTAVVGAGVEAYTCTACPAGKWTTHGQKCADCNPGRYLAKEGGCQACPPGQFNTLPAQWTCKRCPVGRWRPIKYALVSHITIGGTDCIGCDAGQYSDVPGAQACKN